MVTRIAVIDRELCIKEKCGYACKKVCPPNRMGEECIVVEEDSGFPLISEPLCIGCGICVKKCPVKCISIINLAEELDNPIFSYGKNSFRLYRLPLPMESGAVALVGKNGIGKTTAIKLLAGRLDPNLGLDIEPDLKQVIEELPIETQQYFKRIEGQLTVSSKPQHITNIRKVFKGTVKDLIQKTSGKEDISEFIDLFSLGWIADRLVGALSGGELQKAAIAAAYAKNADIYYFDEVTNFLDIDERLRTAIIIKELAESKSVLLAEHDLTILDYISSYVSIFYGEENVYGVASGVKNVRAGINEYLRGYLKDENVRFRDHEVGFSGHSEGELKGKSYYQYDAFSKNFESFSFQSEPGSVRRGEILGLVGKNALGKTLLVNMLSGSVKGEKGSAIEKKISYKPQYIEAEDMTVLEKLTSRPVKGTILEECKRKLKLGPLLEKNMMELSGGELQRVALTYALCEDAEIYLFDEPSAFLDIELRFEFASLLRKVISESEKSAFVVDHDIVFIDAIANRLIVFDGKSSVQGHASAPLNKRDGMNSFLEMAGITMRRDVDTKRPRINKPGSQLDSQQRESGSYYYSQ
jgi:ATP-binding cassette subfamily E protein 1